MRAQELFPDIFSDDPEVSVVPEVGQEEGAGKPSAGFLTALGRGPSGPSSLDFGCRPMPPDMSWLADGLPEGPGNDVQQRQGLILISHEGIRKSVKKTLFSMGFATEDGYLQNNPLPALNNQNVSLVIGTVSDMMPHLHAKIVNLPMNRRRMVYYVLIGPRLRTLYGLEAISLSANMVVNEEDIGFLATILKKGFCDFDDLYGPFLEELQNGIPNFLG